ncbi:hypothetical protein CPter91_4671 [Collimonas pratensis]|uniref:Uncharacterized protein n=1 Tax=Collimonas pratensis TaxID=279113 RepID=A0A127QA76_9BURK|nr:hypothetical protein CPter91_4671 [Collimonas pratensis]
MSVSTDSDRGSFFSTADLNPFIKYRSILQCRLNSAMAFTNERRKSIAWVGAINSVASEFGRFDNF